jgi:flagellar biogenesis protein FliO
MMHLVATIMAAMNLLGGAGSRASSKRHMRLIETLPLGAKKQLLLVTCDGERFLIGTGPESVQSILRVRSEQVSALQPAIAKETV